MFWTDTPAFEFYRRTDSDLVKLIKATLLIKNDIRPTLPLSDTFKITFRADELGYFYPDIGDAYLAGDVISVGKEIYYRTAHFFIQRI